VPFLEKATGITLLRVEAGSATWRARRGSLALGAFATCGEAAVGLLLVFDGATRQDAYSGVVIAVAAVAGFWLFGLRPYIRLDDHEIVVQNPIRRVRLALDHVTAVRPSYSGLVIDLNWNRAVTAWAVQKSNVSYWTEGKGRADMVAETLLGAIKGRSQV